MLWARGDWERQKHDSKQFNIPIALSTTILLGLGGISVGMTLFGKIAR